MDKNRSRKNLLRRISWRQIALLLGVVIVIFLGSMIVSHIMEKKDAENTSRGLETLQDLDSRDVAEIEEKIKKLREERDAAMMAENEEASLQDQNVMLSLKSRFANTIILGDSMAEGLVGYEVLNSASVLGTKGRNLLKCDADVATAIALAPYNIVLDYGLNDVGVENADTFRENYKKVIEKLREALPGTTLYICSITPVSTAVRQQRSEFENIEPFNEIIRELCEEYSITYIDTIDLVSDYSEDGIHPTVEYFRKWAVRMAEYMEI